MFRLFLVLVFACGMLPASAWLFPEHKEIMLQAIEGLAPEYRALLEAWWQEARTGHEERLMPGTTAPGYSKDDPRLDYATWTGIAGDHSCSPADMLDIVLGSEWILDVAWVAERLRRDLAKARRNDQVQNAVLASDIKLQRWDADYATRAQSKQVHVMRLPVPQQPCST